MRLIDQLIERENIPAEMVDLARARSSESRRTLFAQLIQFNALEEDVVHAFLLKKLGLAVIDLGDIPEDPEALHLIPLEYRRKFEVYPVETKPEEGALVVAMWDPTNLAVLDELQMLTGLRIDRVVARREQILSRLETEFVKDDLSEALEGIVEFSDKKIALDDENLTENCSILNIERSPVVRLVDSIISNALKDHASDIHIEPLETCIDLRYRVDGVLRAKQKLPKNIQKHLICRIKIMADLDIAETRRPQDGRIRIHMMGRFTDLRLSIIPTVFGEKAVLRVLDSSKKKISLDEAGFSPKDLKMCKQFFKHPQGMVLVCGPTGSGKTTTLYAALNYLKNETKNIMTVEDPVEYIMEGVNQMQVNERIGVTFAQGLRSILRQDPDTILVGEIRDLETAVMAFRASLTGHLVLSTLHTNCSISAVTRLRNIGIEPFLISSSMLGIISQRLIRMNCPQCTVTYKPDPALVEKYMDFIDTKKKVVFKKGTGCPHCHFSGFKERVAAFEILPFNADIRELVSQEASEGAIEKAARKYGYLPLVSQGAEKAFTGMTTLEEVDAVLGHRHQPEALSPETEEKLA